MKTFIRILVVSLLSLAGVCCAPEERAASGFLYTIDIDDAVAVEEPTQSEIFESVRTIILETSPNALLSRIDKAVRVGERIYILNSLGTSTGIVAEFDMEGRFVRRFGSVGRGPGEYLQVLDFDIDREAGRLLLLDPNVPKILSYDLASGKYMEDITLSGRQMWPHAIASLGGRIYFYPMFSDYDPTDPMLMSIEKDDPSVENRYLPFGEHLKGWANTSLVNRNFIYNFGGEWALYRDRYSNEIYRVTPEGVENHILIESEHVMGEKEREIMSAEWNNHDLSNNPQEILLKLNLFSTVENYYETDRNICFMIGRGNSYHKFMYDKRSGETKELTTPNFDLFVKADALDKFSHPPLFNLLPDDEGVFFVMNGPSQLEWLRKAAGEGAFVDGFDRLEEFREIKEDSTPVLFYLKFK
jgi:hypothetical protein